MHLTECVDLFSESNQFDAEVRECLYQWIFKTKTNFYGYEDLKLDPIFGALCMSYSISGVALFLLKPKWAYETRFPYDTFAFIMTFIQGPLSFSADYMNMTNDSMIHVADRAMASMAFALRLWHIAAMYFNCRPSFFYLNLAAVSFAAFSFMNSQDAQESLDTEGFYFWHNCWHMYPLICIPLEIVDRYVLDEYNGRIAKDEESTTMTSLTWMRQIYRDLKFSLINDDPNLEQQERNDGKKKIQ